MSDNVISLFGDQSTESKHATVEQERAEPQPAAVEPLVRELEHLLEAAKRGEIVGFAGAYQYKSRLVGYSYAGAVQGYAMLGGLECVRLRLAQRAIDSGKV